MKTRSDVRVTIEVAIDDGEADVFYALYDAAFGPLRTLAAARQVLYRDEFLAEMRNPRVVKYIARASDGRPVGLTALSNDLTTVPWISPEFFISRYPEHAHRNAIYYIHFMLAHPDERRSGCFAAMFAELFDLFVARRAVSLYDICTYNNDTYRFAEIIKARVDTAGSVVVEAVDTQIYYSAVFDGSERVRRSAGTPRVEGDRREAAATP